ncbi:MAG: oligosaccharide flippase family protein [Nitrospira sp.]
MEELKNKSLSGLQWLSRYLETDMVYVAKSGFWLTLGQIFSSLLAFSLSIFFANFVSKEIYGSYKFVLSATGILGALSLTGMGSVVIQAVARGSEGILKDAVKTTLKWGSIIFIVGILSSVYYFLNGNNTLGFSMLIAGVSLPLTNAFGLYGGYFSGKKNFKLSTLYWIVSQTLITSGLVIVSLLTKNVLSLVSVYFIVSVVTSVWSYYHVISKYNPNEIQDGSMMNYGKHISLMNFFGTVSNQLDKILVFHYLGAVNLAVYSFSQAIPEQIKGSFKNLFAIALPKYATLDDTNLRKSIIKKTWQLTLISVLIVVLYIIFAPFVFKIFFPKYVEAIIYSQIYMLGLIAIPGISLFATYFQIKKATRTMYKLTTISNVTTTILTVVLIYNFGLRGAVIENGVSWLIMLGINYYFFATHTED